MDKILLKLELLISINELSFDKEERQNLRIYWEEVKQEIATQNYTLASELYERVYAAFMENKGKEMMNFLQKNRRKYNKLNCADYHISLEDAKLNIIRKELIKLLDNKNNSYDIETLLDFIENSLNEAKNFNNDSIQKWVTLERQTLKVKDILERQNDIKII